MFGIYKIENLVNGKVYIGKSKNIERRISQHKHLFKKRDVDAFRKATNRFLSADVFEHGIDNFSFSVLETFIEYDKDVLADAECKWMLFFDSLNDEKGYNQILDSSKGRIFSDRLRENFRDRAFGDLNPNYGNAWTDEQKEKASIVQIERHKKGVYGEEWKKKLSAASSKKWENEALKKQMAEKVSKAKEKYDFEQRTKQGDLIRVWGSIKEIVSENPSYKWQNIYSVCNGYKKSYMGFVWVKKEK